MSSFPAMKLRRLLRILTSAPLNYRVIRQSGSRPRLRAEGRLPLTWAFHDGRTLALSEVRRVLVDQVGLASAADQNGTPTPTNLVLEHYVPAGAAKTAA